MLAGITERQRGFSLIELIVVVAIIGILASIVIPALLTAVDRSRQRRTMADMTNIAKANGIMQVDTGTFVAALPALAPRYVAFVPTLDGWGNAFVYTAGGNLRSYTLESRGSDGAVGPAPPALWYDEPFEPDIVLDTGQFTQHPVATR